MKFSLVLQERRFYDLFARQGQLVHDTLVELSKSLIEAPPRHPPLPALDHEADPLAPALSTPANKPLVTPTH